MPLPQRRALSAALLLEEVEGSAPDERAIAFAVFQLLGEHGERPLLVAVDDVQWLDAASASVLAFALRRLAAAPAAILVARRSDGSEAAPLGLDRAFPDERLRRLRLGPLSVGATHRLLRERLGVSFPRPTLVQLHETSGGNPFYALELGRALEQSGGRAGAGERLTIPTSLTELVSARLAALPEDVREVLEPVALLSEPTVSIVEAVAVRHRRRCSGGFARPRPRRSWSWTTTSAFVSATPCWPRRSRRSSTLGGGDRSIAASRSSSATPSSAPGILLWARDGPSARVADELETASADRGLAWRIGGGRGAGRAFALAHAGRGRRRRPAAAASCSRPTITTRAATWSGRVRSSSRCSSSCSPVPSARAVLRRLGETLVRRLREVGATPRAGVRRGRARSSAAGPRSSCPESSTAFLRHGPAAAVKLARDSAQVVEDSGDLVLLAMFLAQLSLVGALRGRCDAGGARARARARAAGRAPSDARPRRRSSRGCV